ncbi:MAG: hypothetical protein WEB79_10010 [Thermoleophilaceae bacterium]
MGRRHPLVRVLALLSAVALLALAVAGCGGDDGDDDPGALLREAAEKRFESADVELRADADVPGFPILGSRLTLTGSGPIASNGRGSLPTLDWDVSLRAGGQSFPASLMVVDDRAYVEFQGLAYEADPKLIGRLGIGGVDEDGDGAGRETMSLKALGIDPARWLTDLEVEDGGDVGGDSTRLITGQVDKRAVLGDLLAAAESKDVQGRIEDSAGKDAGMLPDLSRESLDQVVDAIDEARVEVNVDDEGYARRVYAKLRFTVPESVKGTAIENGTIETELVLEELGVDVDPRPPADPRPLSELLDFVGVIFGIDEPSDLWRTPR